jgi:hypothetical protein
VRPRLQFSWHRDWNGAAGEPAVLRHAGGAKNHIAALKAEGDPKQGDLSGWYQLRFTGSLPPRGDQLGSRHPEIQSG